MARKNLKFKNFPRYLMPPQIVTFCVACRLMMSPLSIISLKDFKNVKRNRCIISLPIGIHIVTFSFGGQAYLLSLLFAPCHESASASHGSFVVSSVNVRLNHTV